MPPFLERQKRVVTSERPRREHSLGPMGEVYACLLQLENENSVR